MKVVTEQREGERLDRDARQQQIVSACARLIATRGYAGTSIRDVASAVGISTGTLLHHFESKEQLLTATLLEVGESILGRMERGNHSKDARSEMRRIVTALLGESEEVDISWRVWIAFWHEATIHPELGRTAGELTKKSEGILEEILARGTKQGVFDCPDPRASASELGALIDGVAIRVYGEQGGWSHKSAIATVLARIDDWQPKPARRS